MILALEQHDAPQPPKGGGSDPLTAHLARIERLKAKGGA